MPTRTRFWLDELRWRLYQWKKVGLMYFVERPDELKEDSCIDACLLVGPPGEQGTAAEGFRPEPFPVLAPVYEWLYRKGRTDRVRLLGELAYYKLCYERGSRHTRFDDSDQYGLYCAYIERFYAVDRPYRGRAVYWVLFDPQGVEFFSEYFQLDPGRLAKFQAPAGWPGAN